MENRRGCAVSPAGKPRKITGWKFLIHKNKIFQLHDLTGDYRKKAMKRISDIKARINAAGFVFHSPLRPMLSMSLLENGFQRFIEGWKSRKNGYLNLPVKDYVGVHFKMDRRLKGANS